MRIVQKFAIVLTAAVMGVGLLGSPAEAHDTSWGCGGCIAVKR
jgi:hypothetical protein